MVREPWHPSNSKDWATNKPHWKLKGKISFTIEAQLLSYLSHTIDQENPKSNIDKIRCLKVTNHQQENANPTRWKRAWKRCSSTLVLHQLCSTTCATGSQSMPAPAHGTGAAILCKPNYEASSATTLSTLGSAKKGLLTPQRPQEVESAGAGASVPPPGGATSRLQQLCLPVLPGRLPVCWL